MSDSEREGDGRGDRPQAVPSFPRPRAKEASSPYRDRIAPPVAAPPAEKGRLVVTRPEPPADESHQKPRFSGDLRNPIHPDPMPAGLLDELRRAIQPAITFAGNRPHLCLIVVVAVICVFAAACGRSVFGWSSFAG